MVIYGSGYRTLAYEPTGMIARLSAIAVLEFRLLFKTRWGVVAFLACAWPAIVSLVMLFAQYGVLQFAPLERRGSPFRGRYDPNDVAFHLEPIVTQSYVSFLLLTTLITCRAVARDRASGGLEILWTRAITPLGYFVAKWTGSALLLGLLLVACPLVVWLFAVVMAPDWQLLTTTLHFMPQLMLGAALMVIVLTFVATAFSAIAGTPNFASVLWLGLVLGTLALGQIAIRTFRTATWVKALNPWSAAKRLVEWMVGVRPSQDFAPEAAALALGATVALLALLVARRLRASEALA